MYKFVIDGEKIATRKELYESVAVQLPLPGWFGKNLDALYDVLTCDLMPKGNVEAVIVNAPALRENLGEYADSLSGMLAGIAGGDSRLVLSIK